MRKHCRGARKHRQLPQDSTVSVWVLESMPMVCLHAPNCQGTLHSHYRPTQQARIPSLLQKSGSKSTTKSLTCDHSALKSLCSEVASRQRALGHLCLLHCHGEVRGKDMARGSQGSEPGVWNLGGEARPSAIQLSSEVIPCVKYLSWLHWFHKESSSPVLRLDARMCLPAKQIKFFFS